MVCALRREPWAKGDAVRLEDSPMKRWLSVFPLLLVLTAQAVAAQETTTGSIAGRVTDAQKLPVPGATVTTCRHKATARHDRHRGPVPRPIPDPGPYEVKVELSGFAPVD